MLRNLGLTVFLAQVGIASGPKFAATVAASGLSLIVLGAAIVLAMVVVTFAVGKMLSVPADDLLGVVSGVTGVPNRALTVHSRPATKAVVVGIDYPLPSRRRSREGFQAIATFAGVRPAAFDTIALVVLTLD